MANDIPVDLLENIRKRLTTRTEVSRFRAVCKSWRSLISPLKKQPQFPIAVTTNGTDSYTLAESVVHGLAPTPDDLCKSSWLIKVEEEEFGKTRVLHPLSSATVKYFRNSIPKVINLLDYRVFGVAKLYTLLGGWTNYKAAISLDLDSPIFMILIIGKLWTGKLGDDNTSGIRLSELDKQNSRLTYYKDVIFYKGEFYAVSEYGTAVAVDSCLNMRTVASLLEYCSHKVKKYLVESCGELLLVEQSGYTSDFKVKFKVYKLNEENQQWMELEKGALADRILIVGVYGDCFSVTTQDLPGCTGNRIFFPSVDFFPSGDYWRTSDNKDLDFRKLYSNIVEFDMYSGTSFPLTSYSRCGNIFRPPPTWSWFSSQKKKKKRKHKYLESAC